MAFLKGRDVISGQEGTAFIHIDGKNEFMFYIKELEATVKKNKEEVRTLNKRGTQVKATGFKGEGKMTIYGVTSTFKEMMLDYMKNGRDTKLPMTMQQVQSVVKQLSCVSVTLMKL